MKSLILSNFIDPISDTECKLHRDKLLYIVDEHIEGIYPLSERDSFSKEISFHDFSHYVVTPGFYDMHFHWVQDDVRMMPKANLLTWLEKYTWPYEAKFKDRQYSHQRVKKFSKELLKVGTLGGACYSSIHPHTVDDALEHFEGDFIVGNVLMTINSPEYLLQKEEDAIAIVDELSQKHEERYALTPRFAITTSAHVMKETASIVKNRKSFIQTHLSETENEIDFVLSIYRDQEGFTDVPHYTGIYDRCDHLGPKTIMGHGIYLSEEELKRLAETGTLVAHCPTSNGPIEEGGLGSGLFNFERSESHGLSWALGSDIGAGPYLSMLDVIRSFVEQNRKKGQKKATFMKGFYRATRAGEKFLHPEVADSYLAKGSYAKMCFIPLEGGIELTDDVESLLESIVDSKPREEYEQVIEHVWIGGELKQ